MSQTSPLPAVPPRDAATDLPPRPATGPIQGSTQGPTDGTTAVPANGPAEADAPPPLAGTPVARPLPGEIGGPKGPEPTRYGDWATKGRVSDF